MHYCTTDECRTDLGMCWLNNDKYIGIYGFEQTSSFNYISAEIYCQSYFGTEKYDTCSPQTEKLAFNHNKY